MPEVALPARAGALRLPLAEVFCRVFFARAFLLLSRSGDLLLLRVRALAELRAFFSYGCRCCRAPALAVCVFFSALLM